MVTINTSEDLLRALRENPEWREAVRREILSEQLMNLPARFDQFAAKTERFIEEQRQFNDRVEGFMERTDRRFERIEGDISNMRGEYTRNTAIREASEIADFMGFQFRRVLSRDDLRGMLRVSDASGIARSQLLSFRRADLVIEAADADGNIHYIAVEASNTGDERDTQRALRNADFLTRFTGQRAHAAIASVRIDERIRETINSGQVYWHELENRDPVPE